MIFLFLRKTRKRMPEVSHRKKLVRSILSRSYVKVGSINCPEINRGRESREERSPSVSAARPVQLSIKGSPRTLIHRGLDGRRRWSGRRASDAADKSTNQSRRWSSPSYAFLLEAPSRLHSLSTKSRTPLPFNPSFFPPPFPPRSFVVLGESTEVFGTIALKNHSVD